MFPILIISFVLSSALAIGGLEDSNAATDFYGVHNLVYVWPKIHNVRNCLKVKFSEAGNLTNEPFTCQCKRSSPNLAFVIQEVHRFPVALLADIVKNPEEVSQALEDSCHCEPLDKKRTIFMKVNDNYFLQYDEEDGLSVTYLFSNTVPTEKEIREVVEKYDDLKDSEGMLVCK